LANYLKQLPVTHRSKLVLMLSAARREDALTSHALGVSGYLCKPVLPEALGRALEAALVGIAPDSLSEEADGAPAPTFAGPQAQSAEQPHRTLRILVVEDNATNRRIVKLNLESWNHTVFSAENGAEAVDLVRKEWFDLVLMDMQMPVMGGIEATQIIRSHELETGCERMPIIALTANVLKGVKEECLAAGMDDYVSKPVRQNELRAAIERVIPNVIQNQIRNAPAAASVKPSAPPPQATLSPLFDEVALLESVGGSHETIGSLLKDCRDLDIPEQLENLEKALEKKDPAAVARAAHAIKGVVGVFHATTAYKAAQRLEASGKAGHTHTLDEDARELRQALEELLAALDLYVLEKLGSLV
jgi:CheY-like chemotaxis protein